MAGESVGTKVGNSSNQPAQPPQIKLFQNIVSVGLGMTYGKMATSLTVSKKSY